MSEIAAQLVGSPSGTTRIADRLEKDALIVRETPRENRRIVRVQLTERGRKVLAEADETFRVILQETFGDHLTESEVSELRHSLRKLLEQNGAWQQSGQAGARLRASAPSSRRCATISGAVVRRQSSRPRS